VRLPEGADQHTVMQSMLDAGAATRRGITNAHLEPAYRSEPWRCVHGRRGGCTCLHQSERAHQRCIILPVYHQMSSDDQLTVAAAIRNRTGRTTSG
jgi:dTDP-4-amino-4,6-dideoxygalactose transaminase